MKQQEASSAPFIRTQVLKLAALGFSAFFYQVSNFCGYVESSSELLLLIYPTATFTELGLIYSGQ